MISADETDDELDVPEEGELETTEASGGGPRRRNVSAKMRRAFDDLDPKLYAEKRWRRHRRQRFVRLLRKLARLCASCGGALLDDDGLTCRRCLQVDKTYKTEATVIEGQARYVDEFGRPLRLRFTPRMLPVIGNRYDGTAPAWPECVKLGECLTELVRACGAKDSPGATCPEDCKHRELLDDPGPRRLAAAMALGARR